MELNKETLKQARRAPTAACHRAVLSALDVLDMQPAHKSFSIPRWAMATMAAAAVVVLVAAVPPLHYRAANLALDVLGQAIPQADRVNPAAGGVAPLPSAQSVARSDSVFLLYADTDPIYTQVAQYAQVVGATQTVNGITATVEEATVTNNRLFLELRFENLPEYCFPAEEMLQATVTGNACSLGGQKIDKGDRYAAALPVSANYDENTTSVPVEVAFSLSQFPDNGQGKGEKIADFKLSFETKPAMVVYVDDQQKGPWLVPLDSNQPAMTPFALPTSIPAAETTSAPSAADLSQATAMAVPATTTAAAETTAMPGSELPTPRPSSSTPETTAMPSSAPQTTAEAVITPMPSGYTARPKYDPQAEGWTVQNIALGIKTITMAAPSQLKRFDLGTPKLNLQAASAVLSKNNGADGVDVWPTPPSLLNDNSAWLAFFDGEDGVIQVMAYDPGTTSMDGAAQKLDSLWSCGTTTNDGAGNEVTQFSGRPANRSPLVSTLLLYRLPDKGVKIEGKTYPFVIVRVISQKQSDLWTAILLDCTSIK